MWIASVLEPQLIVTATLMQSLLDVILANKMVFEKMEKLNESKHMKGKAGLAQVDLPIHSASTLKRSSGG